MEIKEFYENGMGSNSYIAYSGGEGAVIDCGNPAGPVKKFADENNIKIRYIILTHGHFDHISHIDGYLKLFPDAVYMCHEDEIPLLTDTDANVSELFMHPSVYPLPQQTLREGSAISFGAGDDVTTLKVISTPGHTPGSICLLSEKDKTMFTGDTIFANGGYGRTDFKMGDTRKLYESLDRLLKMDPDIVILPGHGGSSTIGDERF